MTEQLVPEGLRLEQHEDWGIRLVVPDDWFYTDGIGGAFLKMAQFFDTARRLGFTSENIVSITGEAVTGTDDSFPTNPENEYESMLIRRKNLSDSIADLNK